MSIPSQHNRLLRRAYYLFLYLGGGALLLAAVVITIIRLALPDVGRHKQFIESSVSDYTGHTLTVDAIRADWRGWRPRLYLSDVDFYHADGRRNVTRLEHVTLELSPWRSLLNRRLVTTRMTLSGLRVAITRQPDGSVTVEGMELATGGGGGNNNEFADWLFRQDRIDLDQAEIHWQDRKRKQPAMRLTGAQLVIRGGNRSQVSLTARLPAAYGGELRLAANLAGKPWSTDWSGSFYASVTDLRPDNWYQQVYPRPSGGKANLELWGRWEDAALRFLHGRARYRDFTLASDRHSLSVEALAGNFRGERLRDDSWHLTARLDQLVTENGAWPAANLEALAQPRTETRAARYAVAFDYLNAADLLPALAGQPWLSRLAGPTLVNSSVQGELRRGRLLYDAAPDASDPLAYELALRDLTIKPGGDQPAMTGLTGRLRGSARRATLSLQGTSGHFNVPALYPNEIVLDELRGALHWGRRESGWRLWTDGLSLRNADLSLALRGAAEQEAGQAAPRLELALELNSERLENLFRYVPLAPGFRLREWMQRSLHAGRVDSAVIVMRGRPDHFPFRDNDGQLQAIANVSDSILQYSHRWPAIDEATAELLLHNEKVTARFFGGRTFNARLLEGNGVLDDLTVRPMVVVTRGRVSGQTQDLRLLIEQSPLAQDPALQYIKKTLVSGQVGMQLAMSVPIKAAGMRPELAGTLKLTGGKLHSQESRLTLNDVNGAFDFTMDRIAGDNLSARFAGQPVTLRVSGIKNSAESPPALTITGRSSKQFIVAQAAERFPGVAQFAHWLGERLSGAIDWQARLSFTRDGEDLRKRFDLSSELYGLIVDLPAPLGKPAYTRKPLKFSRILQQATPLRVDYAPDLRVTLTPGPDNRQRLKRLDAFLGEGAPAAHHPGADGINLSGHLQGVDLDEWRKLLAAFSPGAAPATDTGSDFLRSADLSLALGTDRLRAFGQDFSKVDLLARRSAQGWQASLQGESVAGQVSLPANPTAGNPANVRLDRLILRRGAGNGMIKNADPQDLPALRLDVADLTYNDYQLGHVRISATPVAGGASFDEIAFSKSGLDITGTGSWKKAGATHYSDFDLKLEARSFRHMLETFNYDVAAIKKGKTVAVLNAGWTGSPDEFSLARLNGSLDINVRKGQLLDVDPAAGRLFGLLSLQALPRRLSLDFSDLFGKGLAFDRIKGSFRIADGNAYTNDLRLSGPGADVAVSGRTGLTEQDYDQLVTVTPQFADNLPVASVLLGPVGIGVGAVLYLAGNVFESMNDNIDSLLSAQYTIKGDWYSPEVERLKGSTSDRQAKLRTASEPALP